MQELALDPYLRSFSTALVALKAGFRVTRTGWNGKGMYLAMQCPDAHNKMTLPYIYIKTADDQLVPWIASQTDLITEDWFILAPDTTPGPFVKPVPTRTTELTKTGTKPWQFVPGTVTRTGNSCGQCGENHSTPRGSEWK
ncbi:DUF2829 domain-containing protein [Methanocorpusculum vombati]|uniref:DUF2829 domain-containing protein n=1 Tax=Methanocorpusculum vombati TaxID=3002864 RepID=A0ABT4IMD6_9EURY|nr:DUF2829 domain-containing protein [Methanocorpusculum vombati]MCZ9319586.1 DUF2829 domain-containing protein [Methanocorpusculum sp.]MCZ0862275.1 DUF2829 domain-containing protein [Methanocorpusculum vombati]MDE2534465.1 DUF2829 domain-containing protein [Methanocorpusculum sp.]MDE2545771.1 DUF2829 domain-containing protein [Methanocorpusculum sp.]MDE2547372.1 DUF2829 domain-containing protein [Methanocorpusculum sp.]